MKIETVFDLLGFCHGTAVCIFEDYDENEIGTYSVGTVMLYNAHLLQKPVKRFLIERDYLRITI